MVAPTLWNIYINAILNLNNDQHYIQAFADDLALVWELESNTNSLLHLIYDKLKELKIELSVDKCQGIAIRSYQNSNHIVYIYKEDEGNPPFSTCISCTAVAK
ncbi:hypothetical protein AVEN_143262-1, partial [Araneus ventricosus]